MADLAKKELKPQHNAYKSDIYSLGMTMLETCTLVSAKSCYDWSSFQINKYSIEDLLRRAGQIYSPFLVKLISDMLSDSEIHRPSWFDIQTILSPYSERIHNFQPFTADNY
jgi:serine/threonine protein kinase